MVLGRVAMSDRGRGWICALFVVVVVVLLLLRTPQRTPSAVSAGANTDLRRRRCCPGGPLRGSRAGAGPRSSRQRGAGAPASACSCARERRHPLRASFSDLLFILSSISLFRICFGFAAPGGGRRPGRGRREVAQRPPEDPRNRPPSARGASPTPTAAGSSRRRLFGVRRPTWRAPADLRLT